MVVAFAATHTLSAAEIRLRARCLAGGTVVKLSDVADIISTDSRQSTALSAIELFSAPTATEQRFVRVREIQDLLLLHGINLAEHQFSGASEVTVQNAAMEKRIAPSKPAFVPVQHIKPPVVRSVAPIVVALRSLSRGGVIREGDVELQHPAVIDNATYVHTIEEAIGHELVRAIPAGKPVVTDSLRSPLAVHRGEVVTVYSNSAGIRIRTIGRSREEGSIGELVSVESTLNRSTYYARVSGIREVEVFARPTHVEN